MGERPPKVTHTLCAECEPKEAFHGIGLTSNPKQKDMGRVVSMLNRGYNENKVALPEFPNTIPHMTANLKKLALTPLDAIALSPEQIALSHRQGGQKPQYQYVRVASIVSPFREQIVWAYLQNACRPGVPDRDAKSWAGEILKL